MNKRTGLLLLLLLGGLVLSSCGSKKSSGCGGNTCPLGGIQIKTPDKTGDKR